MCQKVTHFHLSLLASVSFSNLILPDSMTATSLQPMELSCVLRQTPDLTLDATTTIRSISITVPITMPPAMGAGEEEEGLGFNLMCICVYDTK